VLIITIVYLISNKHGTIMQIRTAAIVTIKDGETIHIINHNNNLLQLGVKIIIPIKIIATIKIQTHQISKKNQVLIMVLIRMEILHQMTIATTHR